MRNFYLVLLAILSMTTLRSNNQDLERKIETWMPDETITKKIFDYLKTHDLSPYLQPKQKAFAMDCVIPVFEDDSLFIIGLGGIFPYDTNKMNALFLCSRDKTSEDCKVELLFISNKSPIPPELFYDILLNPGLAMMYPKAVELYSAQNAHIYISSDDTKEGRRIQNWTFFTPYEKCDASILLQDCVEGGTDIFILHPN